MMNFTRSINRISYIQNKIELAFLSYHEIEQGLYSLDSTVVDVSLRGQGIASKLMNEMIEILKEENAQCIPVCSYTHVWFDKHPEYQNYVKNI